MSIYKRLGVLVPMALMGMFIAACDRNITRVEQVIEPSNCFDCHSDQATFLVAIEEQWQTSVHASGHNIDRGASASCAGCHASEGFIQRVNGEEVTGAENPTVIHCFTCHAPHTNGNFELRWTETAELQNGASFDLSAGNLCVACHQARRNVDTYVGTSDNGDAEVNINSTHWGPHYGVQGDMVIGSNGYHFAGVAYEITNHRGATDDGCVDCHVKRATSNNVVGGHSFNMRGEIRLEGGEFQEIANTAACADCHGDVDDFDIGDVQTDVDALVAELADLLETAGLWDAAADHPAVGVTTANRAGAVWNLLMAKEDRSHGVHNADYIKGLLESSIAFMESEPRVPKSDLVSR